MIQESSRATIVMSNSPNSRAERHLWSSIINAKNAVMDLLEVRGKKMATIINIGIITEEQQRYLESPTITPWVTCLRYQVNIRDTALYAKMTSTLEIWPSLSEQKSLSLCTTFPMMLKYSVLLWQSAKTTAWSTYSNVPTEKRIPPNASQLILLPLPV